MRIRVSVLGVLAACLAANPSYAADFEERVADWTGYYVGLGGSYLAGTINFANCVGLCPANPRIDGFALAVHGGYDHQFANNVVLGGFLSVPVVGPSGQFTLGGGVATFTYRPRFAVVGGARLGYSMGRWMPYAHAGFHVIRMTADASFGISRSNTHTGVQLAVGAEFKMTEHVSTDLRYSFSHTGMQPYNFGGGISNWGNNGHVVTASINYRF